MSLRALPSIALRNPSVGFQLVHFLFVDVVTLFAAFWFVTLGHLTPNWPNVRLNFYLAGVLTVVTSAWLVLRATGRAGGTTGAGLMLASYGVLARSWAEYEVFLAGQALERLEPWEAPPRLVELLRSLGLLAYVAGIALTAAAVIAERRLARIAPAWARPPL